MSSSSRLSLEDFGASQPTPDDVHAPAADSSFSRPPADLSDIYEKGYRAGWDDCLEGAKREQKHIAEALGKRLSEAELSVEEVRDVILSGLKPLLGDVMQKLLPALSQAGFRQQIVDEIIELAQTSTDGKIKVRVSQEDLEAVTALLEAHPEIPSVDLAADPALGLTQAHIKLSSTGKSVDILNVVDGIERAFDAILIQETEEKDISHG